MSLENPTTEEEWKLFRFPPRVVRAPEPPPADEEDDEGEGEQGDGGGPVLGPTPDLPPAPAWEYCEDIGFLKNSGLGKKIDLDDLDEVSKISRLLGVFQIRPDLAFASLRRALETACQARFQMNLEEVLHEYADGQPIPWKSKPARTSHPGMS